MGRRAATPIWAYEIGDTIPLPWWSGALGLWNCGCFSAFVRLLRRCIEFTADEWMVRTCSNVWHYIDALAYVGEPLFHDDLPVIAKINADRHMITAELPILELCAEIEAINGDADQARELTVANMLRQLAKRRLSRTSADLCPMFDLAWDDIKAPFYPRCRAAQPGPRDVDLLLENRIRANDVDGRQILNSHLLNAQDRAEHALREVDVRARLILSDLGAWILDLYPAIGGDCDQLMPLEAPSFRKVICELLEERRPYAAVRP